MLNNVAFSSLHLFGLCFKKYTTTTKPALTPKTTLISPHYPPRTALTPGSPSISHLQKPWILRSMFEKVTQNTREKVGEYFTIPLGLNILPCLYG